MTDETMAFNIADNDLRVAASSCDAPSSMRGNMSSDRRCTGSGTGGQEKRQRGRLNSYKSLASLAVKMDVDVGRAKAIIVYSETGAKARCVAKFRPGVPVAVLTPSPLRVLCIARARNDHRASAPTRRIHRHRIDRRDSAIERQSRRQGRALRRAVVECGVGEASRARRCAYSNNARVPRAGGVPRPPSRIAYNGRFAMPRIAVASHRR